MQNRFATSIKTLLVLGALVFLSACASVQPDGTVEKSKNDKRNYRSLTLDNGLPVLLINDPNSEFAAASMDVFVGSGSDPKDRAGLAHFLEHMLFLGTKEYPNPGEYQAFIKANGGSHNAYTSMEHTNYFFNIKAEALPAALDRFSQFFVDPLLTQDYVEREKHAVNSEYQARIKDEGRRKLDVLRQLTNPEHPFSKFSVGSLDTLSSEVRPIRADLLAFYQKYYAAKNMRLVVYSDQSLDQMEALVKTDFSAIPSHSVPSNQISDPLFNKGKLPLWLNIKPEKQIRELSFLFPMPDYQKDYHSKPTMVLGHILGHEGAGSLYAWLKEKNWIESLSAGGGLNWQGGSAFSMSMELTSEGLQHQQEIVVAVFQTIKRLEEQGIPKWVFDELADISQLNFDYQEETSPLHYVLGLSNAMQYYPAKDVIRAEYLMDSYRPDLINQALGYLNVENVLITLVADGFTSVETSPYYNTPYTVASLPIPLRNRIDNAPLNASIVLPQPNPLLPSNMDLIEPLAAEALPREIERGERMAVWYKPLDKFKTPRASNYYSFQKEGLNQTAQDSIALDLYVRLVNDGLTDWAYPAYLAGLSFDFYVHARGVSLKVDGFNDRQADLLQQISGKIRTAAFNQAQFERVRAAAVRKVKNAMLAPPYQKALGQWQQSMRPQLWRFEETLHALEAITLEEVTHYGESFWQGAFLLALSNGNLSESEAIDNANTMQKALQLPGAFDSTPDIRVRDLNDHRYYEPVESPYKDAGYVMYWQGQAVDNQSQAQWLLLAKSLEAGYFNSLRTEQQLGYIVFANYYPLLTVPGMTFVVQSPVADVVQIHKATQAFLNESASAVKLLPQATFDDYRSSIDKKLREQPKNLAEESGRYWNDLALGFVGFDRREQLADALEGISLASWQAFAAKTYQQFPSNSLILGTQSIDDLEKAFGTFQSLPKKSAKESRFFEYPAVLEKTAP